MTPTSVSNGADMFFFSLLLNEMLTGNSVCYIGSILLFYSEKCESVSTSMFLLGKSFVTWTRYPLSHQE